MFPLDQCPVPPPDMVIEDAQFVYRRNFEGREETYNEEGSRYFNVRVPDEIVEEATAAGWNVKWTKPSKNDPRPEEHVSEPYLEVAVGFKYRPPTIMLIEGTKQTLIGEETVGLLDTMEFKTVDVVIRGREWSSPHGCGIKAWLKTFAGVVDTDDIMQKYANLGDEG